MSIRVASFDMGYINFAQYVEDFDKEKMRELEFKYKALPSKLQRKVKGVMNPEVADLIEEMILLGSRVSTGVYDFTTESGQSLDVPVRRALLDHLNKYKWLWHTCDIFVIEQQYFNTFTPKGKKKSPSAGGAGANVDAIKIGEIVFTWFLEKYPDAIVMYFGSQHKTQILGAPWKMTKPERKKWSVEKAREMYTLRGDKDMITIFNLADHVKGKRLNTQQKIDKCLSEYECETEDAKELAIKIINKQKLDDVADTFTQLQAFKFKTMIACF